MKKVFLISVLFLGFIVCRASEDIVLITDRVNNLSVNQNMVLIDPMDLSRLLPNDVIEYGTQIHLEYMRDERSDVQNDSWSLDVTYDLTTYGIEPNVLNALMDQSAPMSAEERQAILSDPNNWILQQQVTGQNLSLTFNSPNIIDHAVNKDVGDMVVVLTVTNISPVGNIPEDVELRLERHRKHIRDVVNSPWSAPGFRPMEDNHIRWNHVNGAHEYELQWAHFDFYDLEDLGITTDLLNIDLPTLALNPSDLFDQKEPTNVLLKDNSYEFHHKYGTGMVLFRIRSIGERLKDHTEGFVYSNWGYHISPVDVLNAPVGPPMVVFVEEMPWTDNPDQNLNYNFGNSFADNGKTKSCITYYDGSWRQRQQITKYGGEEILTGGEVKYDYEGRAVMDVMDAPFLDEVNDLFEFREGLNPFVGQSQDKVLYDNSNIQVPVQLDNSAVFSSSKYFSSTNDISMPNSDARDYVPDAGGYNYALHRYTETGDELLSAEGNVGGALQIHDRATGKQYNRYFESGVADTELRRFFGTDMGLAQNYTKYIHLDENGLGKVEYVNVEGKTVATATIGQIPENLVGATPDSTIISTILGGNVTNDAGDGYNQTNQVIVTTPGTQYDLDYQLTGVYNQYDPCVNARNTMGEDLSPGGALYHIRFYENLPIDYSTLAPGLTEGQPTSSDDILLEENFNSQWLNDLYAYHPDFENYQLRGCYSNGAHQVLNICEECEYELTLNVTTPSQVSYTGYPVVVDVVPQVLCDGITTTYNWVLSQQNLNVNLQMIFDEVGAYTISKQLKLKSGSLIELENQLQFEPGYPSYTQILIEEEEKLNLGSCAFTCESLCERDVVLQDGYANWTETEREDWVNDCISSGCSDRILDLLAGEEAERCERMLDRISSQYRMGGWFADYHQSYQDGSYSVDRTANLVTETNVNALNLNWSTTGLPVNKQSSTDVVQIYSDYLNGLSFPDDVDQQIFFDNCIAPLHPEYEHYVACNGYELFDLWYKQAMVQDGWNAAKNQGYLDPLDITDQELIDFKPSSRMDDPYTAGISIPSTVNRNTDPYWAYTNGISYPSGRPYPGVSSWREEAIYRMLNFAPDLGTTNQNAAWDHSAWEISYYAEFQADENGKTTYLTEAEAWQTLLSIYKSIMNDINQAILIQEYGVTYYSFPEDPIDGHMPIVVNPNDKPSSEEEVRTEILEMRDAVCQNGCEANGRIWWGQIVNNCPSLSAYYGYALDQENQANYFPKQNFDALAADASEILSLHCMGQCGIDNPYNVLLREGLGTLGDDLDNLLSVASSSYGVDLTYVPLIFFPDEIPLTDFCDMSSVVEIISYRSVYEYDCEAGDFIDDQNATTTLMNFMIEFRNRILTSSDPDSEFDHDGLSYDYALSPGRLIMEFDLETNMAPEIIEMRRLFQLVDLEGIDDVNVDFSVFRYLIINEDLTGDPNYRHFDISFSQNSFGPSGSGSIFGHTMFHGDETAMDGWGYEDVKRVSLAPNTNQLNVELIDGAVEQVANAWVNMSSRGGLAKECIAVNNTSCGCMNKVMKFLSGENQNGEVRFTETSTSYEIEEDFSLASQNIIDAANFVLDKFDVSGLISVKFLDDPEFLTNYPTNFDRYYPDDFWEFREGVFLDGVIFNASNPTAVGSAVALGGGYTQYSSINLLLEKETFAAVDYTEISHLISIKKVSTTYGYQNYVLCTVQRKDGSISDMWLQWNREFETDEIASCLNSGYDQITLETSHLEVQKSEGGQLDVYLLAEDGTVLSWEYITESFFVNERMESGVIGSIPSGMNYALTYVDLSTTEFDSQGESLRGWVYVKDGLNTGVDYSNSAFFLNCFNDLVDLTPQQLEDDCWEAQLKIAERKAEIKFAEKKEEFIRNYLTRELNNCLGPNFNEVMTLNYGLTEYDYTLYYYDQAGNLVQTVPPEGVNPIPSTAFPAGVWDGTEPQHAYKSQYRYDGLNQQVWERTPDANEVNKWHDRRGQLVFSQSQLQLINSINGNFIYTYYLYDAQGRGVETGEVINFGQQLPLFGAPITPAIQMVLNQQNPVTGLSCVNIRKRYYDTAPGSAPYTSENGRNRLVFEVLLANNQTDVLDNYIQYSYDVRGGITDQYVKIPGMDVKHVEYELDPICGSLLKMVYQRGKRDQLMHKYEYDQRNRLEVVLTSEDGVVWHKEARYYHYPHGPLARVEIGDHQVQGEDFYYTLQGWVKGMNMPHVAGTITNVNHGTGTVDPGQDGLSGLFNRNFANDAFAYGTEYYVGDYAPINNSVTIPLTNDAIMMSLTDNNGNAVIQDNGLYNGLITAQLSQTKDAGFILNNIYSSQQDAVDYGITLSAFNYDHQYRLKNAVSTILGATDFTYADAQLVYDNEYFYDGNGNFQRIDRSFNDGGGRRAYDDITYSYDDGVSNRLTSINDVAQAISVGNNGAVLNTDLDGTFAYDANGQLITDDNKGISQIIWDDKGMIIQVNRVSSSDLPDFEYVYDGVGQRIEMITKRKVALGTIPETYQREPMNMWVRTHYIRGFSGNILATYQTNFDQVTSNQRVVLREQNLYGTSQLGVIQQGVTMFTFGNEVVNYLTDGTDDRISGLNDNNNDGIDDDLAFDENGDLVLNVVTGSNPIVFERLRLMPGDNYQFTYDFRSLCDDGGAPPTPVPDVDVLRLNVVYYSSEGALINSLVFDWNSSVSTWNWSTTNQFFSVPLTFTQPDGTLVPISYAQVEVILNTQETCETHQYRDIQALINHVDQGEGVVLTQSFNQIQFQSGRKGFELTDLQGNVRVVVSDEKLGIDTDGDGVVDIYEVQILHMEDFMPYGATAPWRFMDNSYQFGFTGVLKENLWMNGSPVYGMTFRQYDSRIGRWMTPDPLKNKFPSISPYVYTEDDPINYVDLEGLEKKKRGPNLKGEQKRKYKKQGKLQAKKEKQAMKKSHQREVYLNPKKGSVPGHSEHAVLRKVPKGKAKGVKNREGGVNVVRNNRVNGKNRPLCSSADKAFQSGRSRYPNNDKKKGEDSKSEAQVEWDYAFWIMEHMETEQLKHFEVEQANYPEMQFFDCQICSPGQTALDKPNPARAENIKEPGKDSVKPKDEKHPSIRLNYKKDQQIKT